METVLTRQMWKDALEMLAFFVIEGENAATIATPGQIELFARLVFRISKRQHIQTSTQYGKSLFTALACIILTALDPDKGDKVIVVAPTESKAKLIMRYYTEHLGDSPHFASQLSAETKIDRLKQETTKDSLILRNGGSMRVFTLNAGNSTKGFEAAMGEGGDDVIMDEACLVPDEIEATVLRMIAGRPTGMYVKLGNPFYARTHFQKSFRDPLYLKLLIDYHQAVREGRLTQSFIDEAKTKPFFDILYECKFPGEKQYDKQNYIALYREVQLDIAYLQAPIPIIGRPKLGIDVSHGGANNSTIVLRGDNVALLLFKAQTPDELILLTEVERFAKQYRVPLSDNDIFFDSIGSQALCARANELWPIAPDGHTNNFGVNVGTKADPELRPDGEPMMEEETGKMIVKYINLRAQLQARGQEWVQRGGKLFPKPEFDDLLNLRYKIQSDKKIKAKGKDEMLSEGILSPDVPDAFNLTFVRRVVIPSSMRSTQQEDVPMTRFGV
jgi:hypothetical protein